MRRLRMGTVLTYAITFRVARWPEAAGLAADWPAAVCCRHVTAAIPIAATVVTALMNRSMGRFMACFLRVARVAVMVAFPVRKSRRPRPEQCDCAQADFSNGSD